MIPRGPIERLTLIVLWLIAAIAALLIVVGYGIWRLL